MPGGDDAGGAEMSEMFSCGMLLGERNGQREYYCILALRTALRVRTFRLKLIERNGFLVKDYSNRFRKLFLIIPKKIYMNTQEKITYKGAQYKKLGRRNKEGK